MRIRLLLLCILLILSFPQIAVSQIAETVVNPDAGDHNVPKPVKELPYYVLSNCFEWLVYNFGTVPDTTTIRANLGSTGEIGVLYYPDCIYDNSVPGCYHYVRVLKNDGVTVLFDETHMFGNKKTTRALPIGDFEGFYKLDR